VVVLTSWDLGKGEHPQIRAYRVMALTSSRTVKPQPKLIIDRVQLRPSI